MAGQSSTDELVAYFNEQVYQKEHYSICLLGCGEAGSNLAGIFRLKPDFVAAYAPTLFPVRAVVMDTQGNLGERMRDQFRWSDSTVQLPINTELPPGEYLRLLRNDLEEGDPENRENRPVTPAGQAVARSGGAAGFTLNGRVYAKHNFIEGSHAERFMFDSLKDSRVLSQGDSGYLVTFSGLGGGTGSGAVPVVVEWMQEALERSGKAPAATFSVCIVPEKNDDAPPDPRTQYNQLASLYYLSATPTINGVILADNDVLSGQGHRRLVYDMNAYLQDVLMPVFLAPQEAYRHGSQMDPANVRSTLARRGDGHHEFIAAGFSVFPLPGASRRIREMTSHIVAADRGQVPDIKEMLERALNSTTVDCDDSSARGVVALLSGPANVIQKMVPDNPSLFRFQGHLSSRCLSRTAADSGGFARFFMADFPRMKEVRLTVLLSGCRFPGIENSIETALGDDPAFAQALEQGDSLADALRRLPERLVLDKGERFMPPAE